MALSLAFHIIGIILWVGSLMVITTYLKGVKEDVDPQAPVVTATQKAWFGYLVPGFALALLSGIYQISYRGLPYYMTQGWFHGKLTFLIVLLLATALLGREFSRMKRGEAPHIGVVKSVQGLTGLAFMLIVFLTLLGRPILY